MPINYVDRPMNFQRLFPHGGAYLLTEDIMLHDPDAAVIILAWFQDYLAKKTPGTWKLILRPNVTNWLLDKWNDDHR
jgi:chromo domain-containing protein 1